MVVEAEKQQDSFLSSLDSKVAYYTKAYAESCEDWAQQGMDIYKEVRTAYLVQMDKIVHELQTKKQKMDQAAIATPTSPERNELTVASLAYADSIIIVKGRQ